MPRAAKSKTGQAKGKPRGLRRDRDCESCRHRGVKCDLNRPRCLPCVEQGLPCGGYPQRVVWASSASIPVPRRTETAVVPKERISRDSEAIKPGWQEIDSQGTQPPPFPILEPYSANEGSSLIERLSAFCGSLRQSQQPLGTGDADQLHGQDTVKGPQLVSQVDEFLQARLKARAGLASGSTSSTAAAETTLPLEQDEYEVRRLATLASLNEVLETADPVAFLAIAVFAFFEVVWDGAFGEWQRHLRGARSLLDYHCRSPGEFASLSGRVPGLSEMIAYFTWWDVCGTVIRHLSRNPAGRQEGLIFLGWHRSLMDDEFFAAVGCPANTFQLFVSLAESSLPKSTSGSTSTRLQDRYVQAMGQLLQLGSDTTHQGKCSDAWRCVAAIAVLTWNSSPEAVDDSLASSRRDALKSAVDRICQIVTDTPPTSRFYTHMATSVFLAAINASSPDHCRVVETYWRNCQTGEFPRYLGARAQCEEIWRTKGIL